MNKEANNKVKFTMSEIRGILLVIFGLAALGFYYQWWFTEDQMRSPWLVAAFGVAIIYGVVQLFGNWVLYLATHRATKKPMPTAIPDITVDVFVTACGESTDLVERALTAARDMRGSHRTWLLDDGADPALEKLADRLGVDYLTRSGSKDLKAGNVNAALARTNGDVVAIFDIDHAPKPDFLERTLGYFSDPDIGFVQVMLTFENGKDGWVAQAASDSSLDFYNPTSIGSDGLGSATLVGSNAIIRRTTLESIGGYHPGLAEDLATSIAIHAEGWQSVYVAEPLAPGYAPPDLAAWFTQQLKWARGVFELLITDYPRYFRKLTLGQKVSYAVRMTYYWIGPVVLLHLLTTLVVLLKGDHDGLNSYQNYLIHLAPLTFMTMIIRSLALRRWKHRSISPNLQIKPMALVYATWPIYALAWIMAILRVPLGFRATPKSANGTVKPRWMLPQMVTIVLLSIGLLISPITLTNFQLLLVFGFVISQVVAHSVLLGQWMHASMAKPVAAYKRSAPTNPLMNNWRMAESKQHF
ncbi:MAG: glycosyltransferase [Anaerolineales bacterium]|nr:glycosyltransferase [Anaerolineales bacterium]